ncbi:MAG: serine hydroxymethyltransferase [Candidatus Aenigmatarchaeota archaeon]
MPFIDEEIFNLIRKDLERQQKSLVMIPSENYASVNVLKALGSVLTNKYSEGYPGKRYYGGNQYIDEIERLAIKRAKKLFKVEHVNVQPYSGSPANFAVYLALCKPGDTIMGLDMTHGGHLTHGWKTSFSGMLFNSVHYHLNENGYIDFDEMEKLAKKYKPKLIWCGFTAYPRIIDFKRFAEIADDVDAYLVADISHIAGLIVGKVHPSPSKYAHVITTTTHKTLRGPRGAMIMVTRKGLEKDESLPEKIDKAVFPGLQGGPHDNVTAAIAVALHEASQPEFKEYAKQIVKNCKKLAEEFIKMDIKLVSGGTDTHLLLIDLTPFGYGKGMYAQEALDKAGIIVNKNTIPNDASPFYPSGIRCGTPALTTRGMKESEMERIADYMIKVIRLAMKYEFSKENKDLLINKFRKEIERNEAIKEIRKEVIDLCENFPIYEDVMI